MRVVDASVVVAGLVDQGRLGDRVRQLFTTESLVAPELLDVEACATLRGLVAGRRLAAGSADRALERLVRMPIRRETHLPLLRRCWELRNNVTAYDATHVALAERLEVPLLTIDLRLSRATGPRCEFELVGRPS